MWGCIGIGRGVSDELGSSMNWTSGGSGRVSEEFVEIFTWKKVASGMGGCSLTDWVFVVEGELESVGLVFVDWVVVEDFDVHLPFFQAI